MTDIMNEHFKVVNSTPEMAVALSAMQRACFPTIAEDYLITAAQYQEHIRIFPEGQHAVLTPTGTPVAASSDLRVNMDFGQIEHTHMEATGDNWMTTHDHNGEWLYGFDISVHPDHRGHRLSHRIYAARRRLIRKLNLRGHIAGGIIPGYKKYKERMSADEYVTKVIVKEIFDPTLSVQLRRGFTVAGIINHYVDDPSCDNKAALIVWHNDEYKEA